MFEPSIIFQRTHSGRAEIHDKKQGLTQSERLVLIMVDGATPYSAVRARLPVLKEARFERAIQTLLLKGLISEVFMPVAGVEAETVERSVVDRFLQQDPLDPVTIMLHEDDERFDVVPEHGVEAPTPPALAGVTQPATPPRQQLAAHSTPTTPQVPAAPAPAPASPLEKRTVQVDADGEDKGVAFSAQSVPEPEHWSPSTLETEIERINRLPSRTGSRGISSEAVQLAYWAASVGGAFILGFAMARLTG